MLDFRPVIYVLGWITCAMAIILCIPAVIDILHGDLEWEAFIGSGLVAAFIGGAAIVGHRPKGRLGLDIRQAFLVTILGWIVVGVLASFPFLHVGIGITDADFESVSAITTTGSTVLTNLDNLAPGILLWRGILQWVGGIGIIAIAILILPLLRVGGMQLFKIESSDTSEEKTFNAMRTVISLVSIYFVLTFACAILYLAFGMNLFDAITHAMTTLSTGGFSNHDQSFGFFDDYRLHWTATVFMALGAVPFVLYLRMLRGKADALVIDQQVRVFIRFLIVSSVLLALWLMHQRELDFLTALTLTSFNITSIVTTTGFASEDYTTWGSGAVGAFLVLMFVGGCSGSTSGSIKIYRHIIVFNLVCIHLRRLVSPNRVIPLRFNGKKVPRDVTDSVLAFLTVFVGTIGLFTVALTFMGLDLTTAYSVSITAITNVGPGLGDVIGPSGNFSTLPDAAKWLLSFAMLAGRLEVLALLVAFDPDFWRT
jgi:trk system potassium uptake protein TrkH